MELRTLCTAWLVLAGVGILPAQALQITQITPQGEVAQVRQVVVRFDADATAFGDARAPAPVAVQCSDGGAARGQGRWNGAREWVWQFEADLPPGARCTVQALADWRGPDGVALAGPRSFTFATGGPFVRSIRPYAGARIDEEQAFVLRLSGAATPASVRAGVWCAIEGLGERVPVRLLEGAERSAVLEAQHLDKEAAQAPGAFHVLACNRRLPSAAKVQLVYGKGVATPGGIANAVERRFAFEVREPFAAEFQCERENAQAACLPIRPMALRFNAPVTRALAEGIRLQAPGGALSPTFPDGERDALVDGISFPGPFPEQTRYTLALPVGLQDAAGRTLANADAFPLQVATGMLPPLAKFAAAPFGIVERFAEPGGTPMLPVTLRNVEALLPLAARQVAPDAQVADLQAAGDAEILAWLRKLRRYDRFEVPRKLATAEVRGPLPRVVDPDNKDFVQTRMLSLLAGRSGVRRMDLPRPDAQDPRPFEVIGIPLTPGFHVLEISSKRLGQALLDARHGPERAMVVRSAALVTNLAVHFKLGREDALAWVTTLDKGKPVAGAQVRVSDCRGRLVASGRTGADGAVRLSGIPPEAPACSADADDGDEVQQAYFVSARARDAAGVDDLAFTFSDWNRGIESWRFNLPTSREATPDQRAHTVFDRTLLRAGETVSMKHLLRVETKAGLALPTQWPARLRITHVGSGQQFTQPLAWRATASGGRSADSSWQVPRAARLGQYTVELVEGDGRNERDDGRSLPAGQFRVEEFRLPVMEGRVVPNGGKPLVAPGTVPVDVQLNYVAGGGAAQLPVTVSALVRDRWLAFDDFDGFSFAPPRPRGTANADAAPQDEETAGGPRVVADKLPLTLDAQGAGRLNLDSVPRPQRPQELLLEATYADPGGEIQTLRGSATLWPAAVVAGIRTEGWVSASRTVRFQALALDLAGKPQAGVPLEVQAVARRVTSSRKRVVGGFYSYDNKAETRSLGTVCNGKSDARGLLLCEAALGEPGEVELVATARDGAGRSAQAAASVWVTRQGELWFGGEDHDRIDLLPEKKAYEPGETARLQVRMPFRHATALVTVEREGVLTHRVVELTGKDPSISVPVEAGWGPNVYVSALVLRGRLHEVPWYSFFRWGWRAPRDWWTAFWHEGRAYVPPTAMVDLSKPAFRLGVAELRVGTRAHRLDVQVSADREAYPVRGQARVTVRARLPDGKPAAHAEVALAAVDQALLELMPNDSWDLLTGLLHRRAWGVETSTAQMEIVGRRHYGRKAVPAGGGGGRGATRELLDTLLLWNPRVALDANGEAQVTVPLNDALSTFRIVAVADMGVALFGTGETRIRTAQDLQIISGLPPLVREDDRFRAQFTLRNTTARDMQVEVAPRASGLAPEKQQVAIPAGQARELAWDLVAPAALAHTRAEAILWEIEARDTVSGARDALKISQRIVPAQPLAVQQAALVQVDGRFTQALRVPAGALQQAGRARGGVSLALQPRLVDGAGGLPGVRDWFQRYPYTCLEQQASRAIGLTDAAAWQDLMARLPTYLDDDGLAHYFPPAAGQGAGGSDTLTAYLLAVSDEAGAPFALPDALRQRMRDGLAAFAEGRIQRDTWGPRRDLDVRKLAAIEALSRAQQARPRMLESLAIAPDQWPTHAVLDWIAILRRVDGVPQRAQRLEQAQQVLRARLSASGTRLAFGTEREDHWWWLMVDGDVNAARLLLAALDDPAWKDDLPRLATGLIGRQQRGAWGTTTANLWASLALRKFSTRMEATPVTGSTRAQLDQASASVDWAATPGALQLPWPAAGTGTLDVVHGGTGKPWLTLQALAAVPPTGPVDAGLRLERSVTPVQQARPGAFSRGDVLRITLKLTSASDMAWVVLSDPVPGGATILGSGLNRDSQIATQGERGSGRGWPAFEERGQEAFRSYWGWLPKGTVSTQYTVRLNNVGDFALPPTRAEAMYAPEVFGELPNGRVKVEAR